MSLVDAVLPTVVTMGCYLFISSKFFNKRINFKSIRVIAACLLVLIIVPLSPYFFDNFLKIILAYTVLTIASQMIFKENIYKAILVSTVIFIFYFIGEIIFTIILMVGFKVDANELIHKWQGNYLSDILIGSIVIAISEMRLIDKIAIKFINISNNQKYIEIAVVCVFGIGIFSSNNGKFLGFNQDYITNLVLVIVFCMVMFFLLREKEYSKNLSDRYDQLFKYIKKYEKEMSNKSMCIHDFKNQLVVIKGMADKKNLQIKSYIDSIVSDLNKTESNILRDMKNLPEGGLKGLIYYKLGYLDEEGVDVFLKINANTKKSPFSKITSNLYKDILTMMGVYLDNAVEAAVLSDKKEIILDIYYEANILNFILSNTYKEELNDDILNDKNFTTKGKGRGYGLLLANSIINKYENIKQQKEITPKYYIQNLFVDFKNIPKK